MLPALLWLAGCAQTGPGGAPPASTTATASTAAASPALAARPGEPLLAPPPALLAQGLSPVPQRLADAVARYTESAGHGLFDWQPAGRALLLSHRPVGANTAQLFRLDGPLATPQPLTAGPEPVAQASMAPDGRSIVLSRASGGNEAYQLYRLDLDLDPGSTANPAARPQTLLTDPAQRHAFQGWLHRTPALLHTSVPLDRTAAAGRREGVATTLVRLDPQRPAERATVAELPGTGWDVAAIATDDRQAVLVRMASITDSEVWLLDLASGARRQLLPAPGGPRAAYRPQAFSADGRHLWLTSDAGGEFSAAQRLALADDPRTGERAGTLVPLAEPPAWDVDAIEPSADGRWLALRVNVDGRDELRLVDAATLRAVPLPAGAPAGSVGRLQFHPQRPELALTVNSARSPGEVWTLDLADAAPPAGRFQRWTTPRLHPALDVAALTEQQIVRWRSFDGRSISGLLSRPPARFAGRRPVLINIHGGPEGQAKVGFLGRSNQLLQELGIAVLQPNVRGSAGFGKTFVGLDNGRLREDSVKDIGALLDWIATQPDLDASRVAVTGGSYGGYMALAVAATYPERIAATVDVVGISHFVTFLETTESYRRDLRRVEYGDERDPAMRAFLDRISPLTNAQRITRPLFVVQGRNDPRVPYTEAEQIVAKVRANGTPVWYLRAENEGHGFARKENADYQFYATLLFLEQTLLTPAVAPR